MFLCGLICGVNLGYITALLITLICQRNQKRKFMRAFGDFNGDVYKSKK